MDIYLTDKDTGAVLQFPMLPEQITAQIATRFQSYDIMNLGEIKLPLGEELTTFTWSGKLPGELRGNQPYIRVQKSPKGIQELLTVYRTKGSVLRLLITDTPINHDVFLESFEATYAGGYGDYDYKIAFVVAKQLFVMTDASSLSAYSLNKNPARISTPKKTHTVVKGDSLWAIAQKYMGAGNKYPQLYEANKSVIDPRNQKYKMPKYTIYPGQVLSIP